MTEILAKTIHQQINLELPVTKVRELAKEVSEVYVITIQSVY